MSPTKPGLDFRIDITQHEALATVRDAHQLKLDDRIVQKPVPRGQQVETVRRAHADCVSDRMKWQRRWAFGLCITDTAVVCGSVLLGQYVRFGQTMNSLGVCPLLPRCSVDPVHRHVAGRPGCVAHSLSEAGWHGHRGVSACCRRVFLDLWRHCHRFASLETRDFARLSRNWASGRCTGIAAEQSFVATAHFAPAYGRQLSDGRLGCRRTRRRSALCPRAYARTHERLPNHRIEHSWIRSASRREHDDKGPSRADLG